METPELEQRVGGDVNEKKLGVPEIKKVVDLDSLRAEKRLYVCTTPNDCEACPSYYHCPTICGHDVYCPSD